MLVPARRVFVNGIDETGLGLDARGGDQGRQRGLRPFAPDAGGRQGLSGRA